MLQAPVSMLALLVPTSTEEVLVRWMTILANVMSTVRDNAITYATLPTDYKAASPETMYTAIYGLNNVVQLRSRVFVLSKHTNEDVRYNATRIYSCLL